jgi:homoserine O-acetyltransferase
MASSADVPEKNNFNLFHLGDFQLESGEVLPQAFLAYKTFGDIKNPAIIHPTSYTACT